MTAMRLKRYPSPSGGFALGKMGVGATMMKSLSYDAEVEYLESTGTQWINTRASVLVSDYCTIEAGIQLLKNEDKDVIGSITNRAIGIDYANTILYYYFLAPRRIWTNINPLYNDIHHCKFSVDKVIVDGVVQIADSSIQTSGVDNITLFGSSHSKRAAKFSYCRIFANSTLVRDMIPVRFTNELGQSEGAMFDRVSGELFRNAGTGAFGYGNDI